MLFSHHVQQIACEHDPREIRLLRELEALHREGGYLRQRRLGSILRELWKLRHPDEYEKRNE
jgi:hypothetical protein